VAGAEGLRGRYWNILLVTAARRRFSSYTRSPCRLDRCLSTRRARGRKQEATLVRPPPGSWLRAAAGTTGLFKPEMLRILVDLS